MSTWKDTPISEANLWDYLSGCSWQEWQGIEKKGAVALVKEQMNHLDCDLTDEQIFKICSEWVESEEGDSDEDDSWLRERAMLAGMAFGCRGYNEVMGYEVEEHSCYACDDRGCYRCD